MDSLVAVQSLILRLAITANGEVDDMVKNYRKNYPSNRSRMALKITFSMPPTRLSKSLSSGKVDPNDM